MTHLIDSSVWIALVVAKHSDHTRAAIWYHSAIQAGDRFLMAPHALGETFRVLVDVYDVPHSAVQKILRQIVAKVRTPELSVNHYLAAAKALPAGCKGTLVFDSLHVRIAKNGRADSIVTFNRRDFARLWNGTLIVP